MNRKCLVLRVNNDNVSVVGLYEDFYKAMEDNKNSNFNLLFIEFSSLFKIIHFNYKSKELTKVKFDI